MAGREATPGTGRTHSAKPPGGARLRGAQVRWWAVGRRAPTALGGMLAAALPDVGVEVVGGVADAFGAQPDEDRAGAAAAPVLQRLLGGA